MRSFYMRIFKNIICIYVLALCCFAYATMIHAIPDHVYVQEGQKLELDKKIPVTLAMSTKPQSVMAQIGARTFQAMKQERAVETCSQLKQGEYTLTCYLFGILPMKEVQVSVVNGKSLYVSGQVVGIYGAAQGVLVLGSGPVETVDGSSQQPAEHIVFPGGLYYCCKWKSGHEKRRTDGADQSVRGTTGGVDPVAWSRADSGIGGAG